MGLGINSIPFAPAPALGGVDRAAPCEAGTLPAPKNASNVDWRDGATDAAPPPSQTSAPCRRL
ncbi:MAG: hypothetical protein EOO65_03360 [Methanosarcinales archaeon]|nr:MAG: hypothetical protein EOO65_03360 [Methanosarcinales archaeon]